MRRAVRVESAESQTEGGRLPRAGDPVLVTIGAAHRPFTCHVCEAAVFAAHNVRLNTAVAYMVGDVLAEQAISMVCSGCHYVHTFLPGQVQVWAERDGYPDAATR